MRIIVAICILVFCWNGLAQAQQLKVKEVKRAISQGKPVQVGQLIALDDTVYVEKGVLKLAYDTLFTLYFGEGMVVPRAKFLTTKKAESLNDSLSHILDSLGLADCRYDRRGCMPGHEHDKDVFAFNSSKVEAVTDTVLVTWHLPEGMEYDGGYYLIVKDFFEYHLAIIKTSKKEATLSVEELKTKTMDENPPGFILEVIKEDCEKAKPIGLLIE